VAENHRIVAAISNLQADNSNLQADNSNLQADNSNLRAMINNLRAETTARIAVLEVHLSSPFLISVVTLSFPHGVAVRHASLESQSKRLLLHRGGIS
jgi:hypothetical protein